MENKIRFRDMDGQVQEVSFDPSLAVVVNLNSDDTTLTVNVESPTKSSSQQWVGGMKKR